MQRRLFLGTALGGIIAGLSASVWAGTTANGGGTHGTHGTRRKPTSAQADARARAIQTDLVAIEKGVDGRLGVAVFDLETDMRAGHRIDERFAMCSTFKWLLAANILARVDRHEESLERRIVFAPSALDEYAPVARQHTGGRGMTVAELCDATVTMSDNTAANLLLETLGGPAGFTSFIRQLGDTVTRLDRNEPTMSEATPGDPRDTTTPIAMLGNLRQVLFGDTLSRASRARLLAWGVDTRTGDARLRAGVPPGWRVADKTGTGGHGTTNDVGVLWPQDRAPILVTVYLTETSAPAHAREAAIAQVTRTISRNMA